MNDYIDVNASPVQEQNPGQGQPQGAPQAPRQTQPPYQMPPYQTPPQTPPPHQTTPPKSTNSYSVWAIISLIAGLLNFKYPPFGAIGALIAGYVARDEIKKSGDVLGGGGMATAGIILGWVGIAFSIIISILVVLFLIGLIGTVPLWIRSL